MLWGDAIRRLVVIAVVVLFVGACGDDATTRVTALPAPAVTTTTLPPTSTTMGSTTSAATETTKPPPVGGPHRQEYASAGFPGTGTVALLTDVRAEAHPQFVRLVFEFQSFLPEFQITPQEGPILASPSGHTVKIAGDTFLEIEMAPASVVDVAGQQPVFTYPGPGRLMIEDDVVIEMVNTEDFAASMGWVVGLGSRVGFSFSTQEDPPRLIIDLYRGAVS